MKFARWLSRPLIAWACVAAIALAVPRVARAHAHMVRSSPARNAELPAAPARVDIWFNELLDEGFNSIEVFAAKDANANSRSGLQQGSATLDAKDRTHLSVNLQPLSPGAYVVEWRVLSRDGHSAPGRFGFRVRAPK